MENFRKFLKENLSKTTLRQYPKRLKFFFDGVWTKKIKDDEYEKFATLDVKIDDQAKEFVRYYKENGEAWVKGAFLKMVKVHQKRVENGEIVEGTIFNYYKAGKRFCDANDIKLLDWSAVSNKVPTGRKHSDDRAPTEEEIKQIVAYPDRRIKGIIYTMLSSGIRKSSWSYMKWKHIETYEENGKILCAKLTAYNIKRKGRGDKWYYTFITPEAYNALLEYRQFREKHGEKVDGESWVMVHKDDPSKQLSPFGIKIIIERAAQKAKIFKPLKNGKRRRREWQLMHGFRKYFKTKASEVMDHLIVEMCLDHDTGLAESYYKAQESTRRANYLKAVPLLTIEDANKNVDKITAEVTRKVSQELSIRYEEQLAKLQEQIQKQRKDFVIDKFEQKLEDLNKDYVNDYISNGKLKPIPSGISKEQLDKWVKDTNVKPEELAIITPQEVIEELEPINEDDRKILNEYVEENKPYVVLDLPNIAASELGKSVDEVRAKWKKN